MPSSRSILDEIRAWCLSLPDTTETPTWGKPHFRVADKIFAGFDEEGGVPTTGMKLEMEHAFDLVQHDPRVTRAPYVGHKGWVTIDLSRFTDIRALRALILESYRLIAPKKSLAKLDAGAAAAPEPPSKRAAKKAAAKAAPKKPARKK
jgi:predicted DNA-binding protein (MmcQ/YjbR family)